MKTHEGENDRRNIDERRRIKEEEGRKRRKIVAALRELKLTNPKRFVTHAGTHPDELWALNKLRQELAKRFPKVDVSKVPVVLMKDNINAPLEGRDGWQYLQKGTYVLGCGGPGPFNHHPAKDFPGLCTADQVAIVLGLDKKPEYEIILRRIRNNDLQGGGEFKVINETLRLMEITTPAKLERALKWFKVHVDLFVAAQVKFHSEEKERILEEHGKFWTVKRREEEIPVATIRGCDDRDIHRLAHYKHGAEVVICHRTSGNVQIFPFNSKNGNHFKKRVNLGIAVAILRWLEQRAAGIEEPEEDLRVLIWNGFHFGWQYDRDPGWILNGTQHMPVTPTRVPLDRIEEAVALCLKFHPEFRWAQFVRRMRNLPLSETLYDIKGAVRRLAESKNYQGG